MRSNLTITLTTPGSPTLLVAAVNAHSSTRERADYLCDGVADNVEIQSAIDALPPDTGRVVLSEGEFILSATVNLKSNMQMDVLGKVSAVADYAFNFFTMTALNNVTVSGGYYDGDKDTTVDAVDDALQNIFYFNYNSDTASGYDICIRDGYFHNVIKSIGLWSCQEGTIIENNYCDSAKWYHIHGHAMRGTKILNNTCLETTQDCAFSFWSTTQECLIAGNISIDSTRYGIQLYPSGPGNIYFSSGVIIENNYIETSTDHGIRVYSNDNGQPIKILNNIINTPTTGGIYTSGLTGDLTVEICGNVVISATTEAITARDGKDVKITDNYIVGCGTIGISTSVNVFTEISRNTILTSTSHAIQDASTSVLIKDNKIDGCVYGIYVTTGNTYSVVEGNVISGQSSYGMRVRSATLARILANMIANSGTTGIYADLAGHALIIGNGIYSPTKVNTSAGTHRFIDNDGYVTENSGTGSIVSGTTSDVIAHGLSITPTIDDISITLAEDPTNSPGAIWVDTIGAANFTVNCENDPGVSNLDFGWRAVIL